MDNQYMRHENEHSCSNESDTTCGHKSCGDWDKNCGCMFCLKHSGCKQRMLRIVLLVAIIIFVFCIGRMVGKFEGEYKSQRFGGYGDDYRMMDGAGYKYMREQNSVWANDNYNQMMQRRNQMMNQYYNSY